MSAKTFEKPNPISHDVWLRLVNDLVDEVESWSEAENWSVHRYNKPILDDEEVDYEAPAVRIRLPEGEIHVNPIARQIMGRGNGRVDLEAWPSHSRVRLILLHGAWNVITDSNIPLRQPWNRETFIQLARDLAGAV